MKNFGGVITAIVTPFLKGEVDYPSLKRLIQFQLREGVQGFVVSGTTGESPVLSKEEKRRIFDVVKGECSSHHVVLVGTGAPSTAETLKQSEDVCTWGADGLLVVTPYYNKPPQRGLMAHYQFLAERVTLPIMLYNVPGRTGVALSEETIIALSKVKGIIGVKEASGDVEFGRRISKGTNENFVLTSGDDVTFVDLGLAGGRGVISVLSHVIPKKTREFTDRFLAGDPTVARDFLPFRDLARGLFIESNPIPVKCALKQMGLIESDELRLPLMSMDEDGRNQMLGLLKRFSLV